MLNSMEQKLDQSYKDNKEFFKEMRLTIAELSSNQVLIPRLESFITRGKGSLTTTYVFTDGSALSDNEGKLRFGIGVFYGQKNTLNLSKRAPPQCVSMLACELMAASEALLSAATKNIKHLIIILDNLSACNLLAALFQGRFPQSSLLADLTSTDTFIQKLVESIISSMKNFDTLKSEWIRSHQGGRVNFKVRGNDAADQLARLGAVLTDLDQDFHSDDYEDSESTSDDDLESENVNNIELMESVDKLLEDVRGTNAATPP